MAKWNVEVADRSSGETAWILVDAATEQDARDRVARKGIVGRAVPADGEPVPAAAPPTTPSTPALDYAELRRTIRWGVADGVLLASLVLVAVMIALGLVSGVLAALPGRI